MTHPYFLGARHPRVLAHRGLVPADDGGQVWENTALAFAAAHAAGVDYIETDCRVTADGDLVLFHDETLDRLAADPRPVSAVPTAELARLFETHGGLLRVAEALEAFPRLRFNIDVKTDAAVEPIGAAIARHTDRVLLTSFSDRRRRAAFDSVRRARPDLLPAASGGQSTILALRAMTTMRLSPARVLRDVDAVQIPERHRGLQVLTPALIRAAHEHGAEVHVWTVNEASDMRRLVDAGVDGIVTDRADLAERTLSSP